MFNFGIWISEFNKFLMGFMPEWLAATVECVIIALLVLLTYTVPLASSISSTSVSFAHGFNVVLAHARRKMGCAPGVCRYV